MFFSIQCVAHKRLVFPPKSPSETSEVPPRCSPPRALRQDLTRLANMARLRLPSDTDELMRLQADVQGIVGCLESLQEVDTEDVEPLISPSWDGSGLDMREDGSEGTGVHLRGDVVTEGSAEERERLLREAPQAQHGFFVLPNVIKSDPGE